MAILERINLLLKKGDGMTLSDLIDEGVICFLDADNRDTALHKLVDALADDNKILDKEAFFQAIIKREKIVSTGIGMGVAIPHAKPPNQKAKEGIDWDGLDGAPVRLIFMIGGPADQQTDYLKILCRVTAAIKDEDRRKKLLSAVKKEDVIKLFKGS